MNKKPNDDWRKLKIGERICVVRVPTPFNASHFQNGEWDDTLSLYQYLITSQVVLRVAEIDEDGRPWINFETTNSDGVTVSHALAMDDDSWERSD